MASAELQVVLDMLRAAPAIAGDTLLEQRESLANATANLPRPEDVRYESVDANGVPSEWVITPESSDERAILYLHGGAYVMGSVDSHRGLATRLARAAGARVLVADYRLAPEHVFPAAVDDGLAAWRFLLQSGVAPEKAAIAGDSAGGGLTAATLIAVRDAGAPLPAAAGCISPWLDLTLSSGTITTKAHEDPMVPVERMLKPAAEAYLAGADPKSPTASPLFADLSGLPPLLVQVGTAEVLLDDSRSFAERAKAAGVEVELEVAQDMIHVWHAFADLLPEGAEAVERLAAFLRKRW
jgi:acetyl esterase/lipase